MSWIFRFAYIVKEEYNSYKNDTALLKALYSATFEATKKWTSTLRNWGKIYGELQIMFEDRL